MRKLKLEKIAGVVALSYLVLIPVGAIYVWKKVKDMDEEVVAMWDKLGMPPMSHPPIFDITDLKERLFG